MPVAPPAEDRTRRGPDRRILAASVLLAAAAGAWVGQRLQEPSRIQATESPSLIDWRTARDIAVTMSRDEALSMADRRKLDAEYRALVARCVPIVSEYTGDHLPDAPERTFAFDRVDWVNANIDAFERMFAPLEGLSLLGDAANRSIAGQMFGTLNQKVLSAEVGLLLGYLARKVLGQYDLTLLGREPLGPGRLYYVEPNIKAAEHTLGLPRDEFRMWLALHETTHAFEFEAHPWLRPYLAERLERQLTLFSGSASTLGRDTLRAIGRALRGESGGEHWMESIMSDEQKRLFRETQAVMSLLEGFSDYVMDEVGAGLVPDVEKISARFHERRQRRSGFERAVLRLTGMDLKMEQYAKGERFVRAVAEARGRPALARLWDGPDTLPTPEEIAEPDRWIARVLA
jgi:coenzyme F420 biosynthesis associated uncharacterized protein